MLLIAFHWDGTATGAIRPRRVAEALQAGGIPVTVVTAGTGRAGEVGADRCGAFDVVRTRVLPNPLGLTRWKRRRGARRRAAPPAAGAAVAAGPTREAPTTRAKRVVSSLLLTPDRQIGWLPAALLPSFRAARSRRVDTVVSTAPPFTAHLLAWAVSRSGRRRWIADFRDPWVGNEASRVTTSRIRDAGNARMERAVVRRADVVVCATEAMTQALRTRHPDRPDTLWRTIPNGYSRAELDGARAVPAPSSPNRPFTIAHVGNIAYHRTPVPVFRALARLRTDGVIGPSTVRVLLLGVNEPLDGVPIGVHAAQLGVGDMVELRPRAPRHEALGEMVAADLLLLLANRQRTQIPLKTYEYLASGRPVLALTEPDSATGTLVREHGGAVVAVDDVDAIAAVIATALREERGGENGPGSRFAAAARFEWSQTAAAFAALVVEGGPRR